jgi:hypothetical protein
MVRPLFQDRFVFKNSGSCSPASFFFEELSVVRQNWLSHGVTAMVGVFVGVIFGYGFAPAAHGKAVSTVAPVVSVAAPMPGPAVTMALTPTPVEGIVVNRTAAAANWKLESGQPLPATSEIICEATGGQPVVLVRAMDDESVWYVQASTELVSGTTYRCPVVIGNASTPPGTPFQIALIVVRNVSEDRLFKTGAVLTTLPADRDVMGLVNVVRE